MSAETSQPVPRDRDVVVVGAGPAGACAAYHLARGGADVALVEKATLPRYKTCGGGIVPRALREMPVPIGDVVERECFRARLGASETGPSFVVERPHPLGRSH